MIELNPVQQQPTGNFFILFCHLMTKSGLMTLRELMCHVCIEREKESFAIETCAAAADWKKKNLLSILMIKMGLYKWAFKILGLPNFGSLSLLKWLYR